MACEAILVGQGGTEPGKTCDICLASTKAHVFKMDIRLPRSDNKQVFREPHAEGQGYSHSG